jgi:hypothetical protein
MFWPRSVAGFRDTVCEGCTCDGNPSAAGGSYRPPLTSPPRPPECRRRPLVAHSAPEAARDKQYVVDALHPLVVAGEKQMQRDVPCRRGVELDL